MSGSLTASTVLSAYQRAAVATQQKTNAVTIFLQVLFYLVFSWKILGLNVKLKIFGFECSKYHILALTPVAIGFTRYGF